MFFARQSSLKTASATARGRFHLSLKNFASTLAFVESHNGQITPASLSTLQAATKLNQPITTILLGSDASTIAKQQLGKVSASIEKALVANNDKYNHYLPEHISPILTQLLSDKANDFSHFLVPSSFVGKAILPRIASKLDVQPISDITGIESANVFQRFIYAGNAVATIKSNDSLILASIRSSTFEPVALANEAAAKEIKVEELDYVNPETEPSTEFVGESIVQSARPDLGSAKAVVSGGRGLGSKEKFDELLEPLANSLGAAIGASRAAVDSGFVDNSLQVGQTGKIIAPELYVAVGISGAIQHLAGMKDSKVIVAVNKVDDAPIFNVADFGLVGDLFEVVPELTKKINEAKK